MGEKYAYPSKAFFKVLLDSSASKISIPPNFTSRLGDKLLEKYELEANGKSYSVKCDKINNLYYFTHGWLRFVDANGLEDGYFLVFRLNQETSGFSVTVYDSSQTECCAKQHLPDSFPASGRHGRVKDEPQVCLEEQDHLHSLPSSSKRRKLNVEPSMTSTSSEIKETGSKNSSESYSMIIIEDCDDDFTEVHESICPNMSFSVNFRESSWVVIPKDFAVKTGIANGRRVMLLDDNGKRWPVDLEPIKKGEMKLTKGWDEFKRAFRVDPNVTCTFEFKGMSDNGLKVTVKRGRGRPAVRIHTKRKTCM